MIALLLAVIELTGVTGTSLRSRAFFDANNVKVGDPLVLTIDFLGDADFKSLHPPALAKAVSRRDWKLDDVSARTDTYNDARRLTYRVRPMREGVLWFPSLEFGYATPDGTRRTVRSNEIPVHAKGGAQVVVEEMGEDLNEMPSPGDLVADPAAFSSAPVDLTDDIRFAWRKACAKPTADAFAPFDFPAAKLNEATCAIREGNWARAMKVYTRLEWRIGQTPEIERGIVAALAIRYDNPAVELPVWRQVGRPLLKYGWAGRVGLVLGSLVGLVLFFWLLGRFFRAVACLTFVLLLLPANGQDIFQQMEAEMQRMRQRMQSMTQGMSQGFNFSFGGQEEQSQPQISARLTTSVAKPQVGSEFEFIVELEIPRNCTVEQIGMTPSQRLGMTVVGEARNLPDVKTAGSSNVVRRVAVPVRYDVPFKGPMTFTVQGMVTRRRQNTRGFGGFSFTSSNSFSCRTPPIEVDIRPLPTADQPEGFAGVISEGLRIHETLDLLKVETNDVIQVTYRMYYRGYVPPDFLPQGAAFEMGRNEQEGLIEYRRFVVADGLSETPKVKIPYYNPRLKKYITVETGGTHVTYK